jgi:nanoRNase/pAp phosphatase (c-di-AMP/oligoRNAs hydrolase)
MSAWSDGGSSRVRSIQKNVKSSQLLFKHGLFESRQIVIDHHRGELSQGYSWVPAKFS